MKKIFLPILMMCLGFATQVQAEDTDLTTLDNVIYVAPQTVAQGTTEVTLSLQMKNTAEIRGFQFDMYLPEGITAKKNAKGKIQGIAFNSDRLPEDDEHTITVSAQADGAIRFLIGSMYDETFTGNEGELMTMLVIVDANIAEGEYPITLKTMKLSETDISKFYEHAEITTTLTVSSTTGIKNIDSNAGNGSVYDLQGRKIVNTSKKGLYIKNGKKEIVR